MAKRVFIMRHNCRGFANKLWSDMAVCAYALAAGARVWDLARFETGPLAMLHKAAALLVRRANASAQYVVLPPTVPLEGKFAARSASYFFGWLYKNPKGFALYRKELVGRFGPTARERKRLGTVLAGLPQERILIGVCVRQEPFRYFPDGEFLVPPERTRDVVAEYLRGRGLEFDQIVLMLVSDRPVPPHVFKDFTVYAAKHGERTDFFLLSKCSAVIGTNTTFCNLAAWFGDAPHIVATKNPVDWDYYAGKERYFDNKYATFALGVPGQG
jgi:hypothetical protein